MPHSCVHCSKIYDDGAREILHGCSCGSKFFFYITAEKLAKIQHASTSPAPVIPLSEEERHQIEHDVREIIGVNEQEAMPVILDFESVKILKPGKYVIDLHNLFTKDKPLVYTLEEGKYFIDLGSQLAKPSAGRK